MKLKIADLELKYPTVLAPMASLTDIVFRRLLDEIGGVGLMITELISAEGLLRKNGKTMDMIRDFRGTVPSFIQLFGANPAAMAEAARQVEQETNFDGIDINMGCPAGKVIRKGAGVALMKDPRVAGQMVAAVRNATRLPVSVKIRLGYSDFNAPQVIRAVEDNGADAIAVHFRLHGQRYGFPADWGYVPELKSKTNLPFIGNGDIDSVARAQKALEMVDGIMIGRGAVTDPLIFHRLTGNSDFVGIKVIIRRLTELVKEYYGPRVRLARLKAMTRFMIFGRNNSRRYRNLIYRAEDFESAAEILCSLASKLDITADPKEQE